MLLSRLVRTLPARGAVLVVTSNYPPQGLHMRLVVLATGPPAQMLDADLTDAERMRSRLHLLQAS